MDAVLVERGQVGVGIERFRAEHTRALPLAGGQQLHGDNGVEAGLPRDGTQAEIAPARVRVRHLVQEDLARLAVLASDDPRPHDRASGHLVAHLGRVGRDCGQDVARGYVDALDADPVRAVHAQRVDGLELVDEVRAQRVLERGRARRAAGQVARHEQHFLVLDVDALDLADALREGEQLRRAEGLSSVPVAVVPDDRRVQALFDRRPDRKHGREGVTGDGQVATVADMDLVDAADVEQMLDGIGSKDVGQPRIHAHAQERQATGRLPRLRPTELLITQLQTGLAERIIWVWLRQARGHVHVIDAGGEGAIEDGHHELRIDRIHDEVDAMVLGNVRDALRG